MAGKIPDYFIQDLLARVDLVDLIDARIPLKRSGSNFVARCPFHNEKTPSFNVSRERQFYHCFGCGASGNAIGFLMEYDRLNFLEAVEDLAESVGLKVPRSESRVAKDPKDELNIQLYDIQERVARYYQQILKTRDAARAVEYLKERGVSGEIARRFRVGYAPSGWRNLPAEFPRGLLEASGLMISKDGGSYDRFRNRIMFPIRDRRGRVVGFGGRVMDDVTPKYLNSPETAVFKKHKEVYGLYELLSAVRKPLRIIVVEGYMDVIALVQHGIPNVVATLGTATSAEHIRELFRQTSEIVICFDGDAAGRNAAWGAMEAGAPEIKEGRSLRFLFLPDDQDPDSLVRERGADDFLKRVELAKPFTKYLFEEVRRRSGVDSIDSIEQGEAIRARAQPVIDQIPSGSLREELEKTLENLMGELSVKRLANPRRALESGQGAQQVRENPPPLLRTFLALLVQNPMLAGSVGEITRRRLEGHSKAGEIVRDLFALTDREPKLTAGRVLEFFRGSPKEGLITRLLNFRPDDRVADETEDCIRLVFSDTLARLERQLISDRLERLIQKSKSEGLSSEEREEMRKLMSL